MRLAVVDTGPAPLPPCPWDLGLLTLSPLESQREGEDGKGLGADAGPPCPSSPAPAGRPPGPPKPCHQKRLPGSHRLELCDFRQLTEPQFPDV